MDYKENLNLESFRRFGAELEINSFDGLDRPEGWSEGKLPSGIHYIGNLVRKITDNKVLIHRWGNDHYNDVWVVKPDGSCGIEICTPVLKGWHGLMSLCHVVDGLKSDSRITADSRCSFHVHMDVADLNDQQLASILTWWIKAEPVFMDSVPSARKKNQYCQFIGLTDMFDEVEEGLVKPEHLFNRLGHCKYYTVNTFHYMEKKRKTIEFRIMDSACCTDSWMTKNWIRLLLHFIEQAIKRGLPSDYSTGDKWSGYCWLDPIDVFEFLGFMENQYNLSPALQQVRSWFVDRLFSQGRNTKLNGVMSDKGRRIAQEQIAQLYSKFGKRDLTNLEIEIYSENFRV